MVDIFRTNFEPLTFCCVLFVSSILVYDTIRYDSAYLVHISVNVIDINMYQSANIGVKCVTFVSETFTRYGSNKTNLWQKIYLAPLALPFSRKVVHEKL